MQTFYCDDCGCESQRVFHRLTEKGQYCRDCAGHSKCAACGEQVDSKHMDFKTDVNNYICTDCEDSYKDVRPYIKKHYSITNATELALAS